MGEDRKKSVWPWIVALLGGLLLLYAVSFGPACWLCEKEVVTQRHGWLLYRPVTWVYLNGPHTIRRGILLYANFWGDERRIAYGMFPHLGRDSKSPIDYEIWHDFWSRKSR